MGAPIQVDETSCDRFVEIRAAYWNVILSPIIRRRDPAARKTKAMGYQAWVHCANEGILAHTAWSHHKEHGPGGRRDHRPCGQMSIRLENRTDVELGQGD